MGCTRISTFFNVFKNGDKNVSYLNQYLVSSAEDLLKRSEVKKPPAYLIRVGLDPVRNLAVGGSPTYEGDALVFSPAQPPVRISAYLYAHVIRVGD